MGLKINQILELRISNKTKNLQSLMLLVNFPNKQKLEIKKLKFRY